MTRIKTNFRGQKALLMHFEQSAGERLREILERLGLSIMHCQPNKSEEFQEIECDLVLFDADEDFDATALEYLGERVPVVAVVGNEAPSRLARVHRCHCNSHILKPIRNTGVYTAVLLATNGHEQQRQAHREVAAVRQRLAGRRVVMKAVLKQMTLCGIDEDAAYGLLRRSAMERRIPIEAAARLALNGSEAEQALLSRRPRQA